MSLKPKIEIKAGSDKNKLGSKKNSLSPSFNKSNHLLLSRILNYDHRSQDSKNSKKAPKMIKLSKSTEQIKRTKKNMHKTSTPF